MKTLELELSAPPLCIRTWHRSPPLPSISAKCVDASVCCSHHSAVVAAGNVGNLRPMEPKEERENGRGEGREGEIGRRERGRNGWEEGGNDWKERSKMQEEYKIVGESGGAYPGLYH